MEKKRSRGPLTIFLMAMLLSWPIFPHPAGALTSRILQEWQETGYGAHPSFLSTTLQGHLIVVRNGFANPSVVELDSAGQKVWEYGPIQATAAVRLTNGRTLICDSGAPGPPSVPRVIEVTPTGQIVWQYQLENRAQAPKFAQRLSNGSTLIALSDSLRMVDSQANLTWSSKAVFTRVTHALELSDGNLLVTDRGLGQGGKAIKLDTQGQTVWEYPSGNSRIALIDPIASQQVGNLTKIFDLGAARVLTVDNTGTVVDVLEWRDVRQLLPLSNQWWVAPGLGSSFFLSCTYTSGRSRILEIDNRSVRTFLNGEWKFFDLPPVMDEGQVLVPVREMAEAFSGSVNWDPVTGQATITGAKGILTCTLNQKKALLNGQEIELPVAPSMYGGNTLVAPYALLAETLGVDARWEEAKLTLYLTYPGTGQTRVPS